jgi:2-polyprenyl-3-methyl-5-hydroxy-6-metoxy-1,4-benzoquinol methylase
VEEPDVETSSEAYARRFSGPVGRFFLELQASTTLELLRPCPAARLLDVGGGHGQVTGPLVGAGFDVTILASTPACIERVRGHVEAGRARFTSGPLMASGLPDRGFDVVLSYRLISHVKDWPALVAELCRLAGRAVVIDYPSRRSVNAFAEALFSLKKHVEKNTRPFTVFRDADIARAFAAHGFRITARRAQFFFPMALHRALRLAPLSRISETAARVCGLTALLGSPVILRAERAPRA